MNKNTSVITDPKAFVHGHCSTLHPSWDSISDMERLKLLKSAMGITQMSDVPEEKATHTVAMLSIYYAYQQSGSKPVIGEVIGIHEIFTEAAGSICTMNSCRSSAGIFLFLHFSTCNSFLLLYLVAV